MSVLVFAVIEEFVGLELVLLLGFGEDQFHFDYLCEVDVQTVFGQIGWGHDFGSGESLPVHLQQELEEIPGRKREVVQ